MASDTQDRQGGQGGPLLEVDGLCVTLFTDAGELRCIQDLSFSMLSLIHISEPTRRS